MRWLIYGWVLAMWQRRCQYTAADFEARDRTLAELDRLRAEHSAGRLDTAAFKAQRDAIYAKARRRQMWGR